MSILVGVLLVFTLLYLLGGHRVAEGRYAATNPRVKMQLWLGVLALAIWFVASLLR